MKKSKLLAALVCSASMLIGSVVPSVPAMADAMKVVTLGADLSEDQKNTMLRYFKVDSMLSLPKQQDYAHPQRTLHFLLYPKLLHPEYFR